ncbi:MAG: DUF2612 domain-containing protein [Candidatus Symbiopectobacterium sp. Dall1.0]|nr:DUF2612 domain-containing protein [Candidatus Symbiopectobacterium sp. Dall1.0]
MTNDRHGLDLLLSQYANSPNIKKYIEILVEEIDKIISVHFDIIKYRQLANAYGVQLDDIAYLVGASRIIFGASPLGYFGYYSNAQALGIGDDGNSNIGGFFMGDESEVSGDLVLVDEQLRGAIRARVVKIVSNCNINDILSFCDLLVGRSLDIEITEGEASLHLRYHGILNYSDRSLLANIIPEIKTSGVTFTLSDDMGDIEMTTVRNFPENISSIYDKKNSIQ